MPSPATDRQTESRGPFVNWKLVLIWGREMVAMPKTRAEEAEVGREGAEERGRKTNFLDLSLRGNAACRQMSVSGRPKPVLVDSGGLESVEDSRV